MRPIYCHFLDREFADTAGYNPTQASTGKLLATAILLSDPFSYASLSGLYECPGISEVRRHAIPLLTDLGLFNSVSNYPSSMEFIASRQQIYRDDSARYQFYFETPIHASRTFTPTIIKPTSTTRDLALSLPTIIEQRPHSSEASDIVAHGLSIRENRAVTFAHFKPLLTDPLSVATPFQVRAGISIGYTLHHLRLMPGSIVIPGIPGLSMFDVTLMGERTVIPNFAWFKRLFYWVDPHLGDRLSSGEITVWKQLATFVLSENGELFRKHIYGFKESQHISGVAATVEDNRALSRCFQSMRPRDLWTDSLMYFAKRLHAPRRQERVLSSTVLVHCVSDNERIGIREACESAGLSGNGLARGERTVAERLGRVGDLDFLLVRSRAGSAGPLSAQGVIQDAISDFDPRLVLGVGVAFGLKDRTLNPRVLLATEVRDYERVRIGTSTDGQVEVRERGSTQNPDPVLLGKLKTLSDVSGIEVTDGLVLSGEKLVDWEPFREELKSRFPDAVGGEMESTGLAAACARRNTRWIMLKTVSDLGDGAKSRPDEDDIQVSGSRLAMRLAIEAAKEGLL